MPDRPDSGPRAAAGVQHGFGAAVRLGMRSLLSRGRLSAALVTVIVAQGAVQGLLIWTVKSVLESLHARGAQVGVGAMVAAGAAIFAVWMLRSVTTVLGDVLSTALSHRVEIDWMLRLLDRLLAASLRFHDRSGQSDLIVASYHDVKGIRGVTLEMARAVMYLAQVGGLMVAAYLISPTLTLLAMLAVPIGVLPAYWAGKRITEHATRHREAVTTLFQHFLQVAFGIRLIKVNRLEPRLVERAVAIGERLVRHLVGQAVARGGARVLLESVAGLGLVLVLVLGAGSVDRGGLTWPALLGLLVAIMAIYSPVVGLVGFYGNVRSVMPNLDRIATILAEVPEPSERERGLPFPDAPREIAFEQVSFAYGDLPVLQDVSFRIQRGETVGLVGPSGAGKSTIMALCLGLYEPTRGRVTLDGIDLREIRRADVLAQCAVVLQEPLLFADTVAANIRLGRPEAGMAEVEAAARAANIHEEILEMGDGYETVLGTGPRARGVSVGQKQRLNIAAALLRNAPLLFLDEATSSLDSVSELQVQAAVERLMSGRTSLVVAHRLSTLRHATRLLVLQEGRLVGSGTHEELLLTCDTYRHLWNAQSAPGHPATSPAPREPAHVEPV